jgi:hypothetical protein
MASSKSQTLKNSHSILPGRTIIQRIEIQMDKRRKVMEQLRITQGFCETTGNDGVIMAQKDQALNQGRYEGLAAAIALLRSSSVAEEISRSNERLGIE